MEQRGGGLPGRRPDGKRWGFAAGATKGDKGARALPEVESVRSYFDGPGDRSLVSVQPGRAISLVALKGG